MGGKDTVKQRKRLQRHILSNQRSNTLNPAHQAPSVKKQLRTPSGRSQRVEKSSQESFSMEPQKKIQLCPRPEESLFGNKGWGLSTS